MDYADVEGFAAAAIGEPGARTFLLQFSGPWGRHTYLLEKGQVAALAAAIDHLVAEAAAEPNDAVATPDLIDEPPMFRIGQLGLGLDEATGEAVLSLTSTGDEIEEATYRLSLDQLVAASRQGEAAVAGGRPACPRCGLAMDPEGHTCPTSNGDLRHHQP